METVLLRGVEIGAGIPKLVVPLTGATREELLAQGRALADGAADVAEWRADLFGDAAPETAELKETLEALRGALGETPLLFTFRTRPQGGARELDAGRYAALCVAAARSGSVDAVDVELTGVSARRTVELVHSAGVPVVGSWHDFGATPPGDGLLMRLRALRDTGADILKLAVMPGSRADVLMLLEATEKASRLLDRPIVTVSMSKLGTVSRVCAGAFGSAMTFGCAEGSTEAGQIPARQLREVLDLLYH